MKGKNVSKESVAKLNSNLDKRKKALGQYFTGVKLGELLVTLAGGSTKKTGYRPDGGNGELANRM